ncbi:MAG: sugar phosphate nucleotidyltransferase [Azospirillaceae bacterium]
MSIRPVILSGGIGSRLWPLSRQDLPKQFSPFLGDKTLFARTLERVSVESGFLAPIIVANIGHRPLIERELAAQGIVPWRAIYEPEGRDTAAAVALAALEAAGDPDTGHILVMPCDHEIADAEAFRKAVRTAAAQPDRLMTFGIRPERPDTAYGYIKGGGAIDGTGEALAIDGFKEKPRRSVAERYLEEGGYLWNSGIFLLPPALCLAEMETHAPTILATVKVALDASRRDAERIVVDADGFAQVPNRPFDRAIMEQTANGAVLPVSFGWSDIGSWDAFWEFRDKDSDGNVVAGDVLHDETSNSIVISTSRLVTVIGLEGYAVIETPDTVTVLPLDRAQAIKDLLNRLRQQDRVELREWPRHLE